MSSASDTMEMFDSVCTREPQIVIGSSIGAWMALQVAIHRPQRVKVSDLHMSLVACACSLHLVLPEKCAGLGTRSSCSGHHGILVAQAEL